jgi:hypothetical protein
VSVASVSLADRGQLRPCVLFTRSPVYLRCPPLIMPLSLVLVEQREMITMATRSATIFAYRVPLARIIKLSALSGAVGALALEHLPAILALFIH